MIKKTIVLIFMLSLFITGSVTAQSQGVPECLVMEARELISKMDAGEKLVIVDLRSADDYDTGHIPGAISMPGKSARDRLPVEINKNDKVVIVSVDGQLAWIACRNMIANDHPLVHSLKGGMSSWNGPVEK